MSEIFNLALAIIQLVKEIISLPINFIAAKQCIISFMITFIWICVLCWILYRVFILLKGIFKLCVNAHRLKYLSRGYGGEVAVLKYILDNPRGNITWLPFDNASMLSLSKKGLLEQVGDLPAMRKSWRNVRTMCYPYAIPEYIRKYINARRKTFDQLWGDVQPSMELKHYQNSISDEPVL